MQNNVSVGIRQTYKLLSYLALLGLLLLSAWIYLPVLDFQSIVGPDQEFVLGNTMLQPNGASNIWDIFLSDVNGRYQPLTMLSYKVDNAIFSSNPLQGHHLLNLILHLLNIILLYRIAILLSKNAIVALSAAAILAIHPMNVESVAWIFSRSVLLCTFFFLLGIASYLYRLKTESKGKQLMILSVIWFILSVFSNPMGIVFPIALVLIDYAKQKNIRKSLNEKLPFLIISGVFIIISALIMTEKAADLMNPVPEVFQWLIVKIYALAVLLWHFIAPFGQAGFHPYPTTILLPGIIVVVFVAAMMAIFYLFKKIRSVKASIAFFLLSGVLTLVFATHDPALYREQDAYLPFLGLYILVGIGLHKLIESVWAKNILIKALVMLLPLVCFILLAIQSVHRVAVYSSSEDLWTEVIETYPESHHAFFMRGNYWSMQGMPEKAKFDYQQCIRNNKNAYEALTYLGLLYMQEGTPYDAIPEFGKAIEINEGFYKAYLNRGLAYMSVGKNELALEDMDRAVALNASDSRAYFNRGLLYERINALEEAIQDFSLAINIDPYVYAYYKERGKAYVWKQEFYFAERDYSRALEIYNGDAEMWFRRSLARVSQNKFKEGLEDAFMARKLGFTVEEEYIKGLTVQILHADSALIE